MDSTAALAVTARRGNGKLRHVRIGDLWVQEAAANGDVSYRRVPGNTNPADLLTKHLLHPLMQAHVHRLGLRWATGHGAGRLHLDIVVSGGKREATLPPGCPDLGQRAEGECLMHASPNAICSSVCACT